MMENSKLAGDGFSSEANNVMLLDGLVKAKVLGLSNSVVQGGFCCFYLMGCKKGEMFNKTLIGDYTNFFISLQSWDAPFDG